VPLTSLYIFLSKSGKNWTAANRPESFSHVKGEATPKKLAIATSEKRHRLQAGNWFPDYQAH
jgi:hypothetical protein